MVIQKNIGVPYKTICMKITKYNLGMFFVIASILILFMLFFVHYFLHYPVINFCHQLDVAFDIINIILAYKIYKNAEPDNNKIALYLILSILFLFMLQISYLLVYGPLHLYSYVSIRYTYNVIHYLYYFFTLMCLTKVFIQSIVQKRQIMFIFFLFSIIDLSVFTYFSLYSHYYVWDNLTAQQVVRIVQSCIEILVFNVAILWLIYSKNIESSILATGYVILAGAEFMITSCYISKVMYLLDYGDILWAGGGIFIALGMLMTTHKQNYNTVNWVKTNMSIRGRLTFWAFAIAFLSLIIFFIIVHHFATISPQFFIFFPTIIISYSLIVVFFSILVGTAFEHPFIQIQNNIENMLINNAIEVNENFTIDEFIYLQKHLSTTISTKEEKDKITKQFGEFAAEVAHDIESPLNTLEVVVSNLKDDNTSNGNIIRIETSMQNIKNITQNLLNRYRSLNKNIQTMDSLHQVDNNTARYVILSAMITQIVDNKVVEWKREPCNLRLKIADSAKLLWVYISLQNISRVISNLLNNSYESLNKKERNIMVNLLVEVNHFVIIIKDNGCGIPSDKINEVLSGTSLKHIGNGIGLTSAVKFLESMDGNLKLKSKVNVGTIVKVTFPIKEVPQIFANHVCITTKNVVVLDDDPNIIVFWQERFCTIDLEVKYFVSVNAFIKWIKNCPNTIADTTFLMDYSFAENSQTGLDIISKFNLQNIYLVTKYAEEPWLQEKIKWLNIKLLPKACLDEIICTLE